MRDCLLLRFHALFLRVVHAVTHYRRHAAMRPVLSGNRGFQASMPIHWGREGHETSVVAAGDILVLGSR